MRIIHPEILLDSHKKDDALKTAWIKTESIANNPHKFNEWIDAITKKDPGFVDLRKDVRTKWETRMMCYYIEVLETLLSMKKEDTLKIAGHIADCVVHPLNTLIRQSEFPYSYHMLTRNKDYEHLFLMFGRLLMSIYSGFNAGLDAKDSEILEHLQTHNIAIFSYLTWKLAGQKTYTVTPNLAEALKATTLKKYPADLLKSPSPCVYIEFPFGAFNFTTYADRATPSDTGHVCLPVEGAYILEDTSPQGMHLWRVVVICPYTGHPSKSVHINHYYIPLYEDKPVDDCVTDAIAMMKGKKVCEVFIPGNEIGKIGVLSEKTKAWSESIVDSAEDTFRFLMNVIIYITHGDADAILINSSEEYAKYRNKMLTAQGKKRDRLKQKLNTMNDGTRILLGKNYVIKRWDQEDKVAGEPTGRHITVRTLVSGHWRNQVCGVKGLERKVIWIEPHWRGPEAAPLTEKRAVVK